MKTSSFKVCDKLIINGKLFEVSAVKPNDVIFGTKVEDLGTIEGTFSGSPHVRTIHPRYIRTAADGDFEYDFSAR